jgi:hypothetical protein
MVTSRHINIVHLGMLVCFKSGISENEWPNFEFFPVLDITSLPKEKVKKFYLNGIQRPIVFRESMYNVLKSLNPGTEDTVTKIELTYKKKPMP